jgi:hypothetical protein
MALLERWLAALAGSTIPSDEHARYTRPANYLQAAMPSSLALHSHPLLHYSRLPLILYFNFHSSQDILLVTPTLTTSYYKQPLYITKMRILDITVALSSLALFAVAAPTPFGKNQPSDGMPSPSPEQLKLIEQAAHGTLPNGPPPPVISSEGIVNLKLIAFNELFEVAFFNELITNITNKVEGYDMEDHVKVLDALKAILAVRIINVCI